jgi:hypothetical protein
MRAFNRRTLRPLVAVLAALSLTTALVGCNRDGSGKGPAAGGDPVESAKAALRAFGEVKNLNEASELLTNQSAAALGAVMVIPLGMMAAFSDNPEMSKDIENVLKKYELEADKVLDDDAAIAAIESRGRELFRDIAGLFEKYQEGEQEGGPMGMGDMDIDAEMDKLTFEVVDATTVRVVHAEQDEPIEVRFEENAWRLHFGDLADLKKQMGAMGG